MNISREACRLCLSTTEFNISLFSSYCRKNNMLDKILVCLKLIVEETDQLTTICYKCAENVERFHDFITFVMNLQAKLDIAEKLHQNMSNEAAANLTRHNVSYARDVIDADYSFSFLDISKNGDQKEAKISSPFSYFSPPNMLIKPSIEQCLWKTRSRFNDVKKNTKPEASKIDPEGRKMEKPRQHSIDLFESQSQDVEDIQINSLDWKLTPDEALFKRLREKCFGKSDF